MKILVLNCGSSSIKFQLISMKRNHVIGKGTVGGIGSDAGNIKYTCDNIDEYKDVINVPNHKVALETMINLLTHEKFGVLTDKKEIIGIGHRVVHGGEKYAEPVKINEAVIDQIRRISDLAPLHNPHNLKGIDVCQKVFAKTPNVAVFDTSFHQTIEKHAYMYPIPPKMYLDYGIRRYGFHGTSHKYVSKRAAEIDGTPLSKLKMITCHLGNGASVAAIKNGKVVDTSMGFTPLEGLMMGTRSGDIDPSIVFYLMDHTEMTSAEVNTLLNKNSGLFGVSGLTNDMSQLLDQMSTNKQAKLAIDMFCYRLRKYIGAYAAVLGGVDIIVMTGGIGENCFEIRAATLANMDYLGVQIDGKVNRACRSTEKLLSKKNTPVRVYCVPTNEELVIAQETLKLIKK